MFRENLRNELYYQNINLKRFAKRIGINYQRLNSYTNINKNCMPPADIAVRIARELDVTVEYLVTGEDLVRKKNTQMKMNKTIFELSNLSRTTQVIIENLIHILYKCESKK